MLMRGKNDARHPSIRKKLGGLKADLCPRLPGSGKVPHVYREAQHRLRLVASANFPISATIASALLAEFFLVEARRSQLSALTSVGCVAVVVTVRLYSDATRSKFHFLRER